MLLFKKCMHKTIKRYYLTPIRMASMKNKITQVGKNVGKLPWLGSSVTWTVAPYAKVAGSIPVRAHSQPVNAGVGGTATR